MVWLHWPKLHTSRYCKTIIFCSTPKCIYCANKTVKKFHIYRNYIISTCIIITDTGQGVQCKTYLESQGHTLELRIKYSLKTRNCEVWLLNFKHSKGHTIKYKSLCLSKHGLLIVIRLVQSDSISTKTSDRYQVIQSVPSRQTGTKWFNQYQYVRLAPSDSIRTKSSDRCQVIQSVPCHQISTKWLNQYHVIKSIPSHPIKSVPN